MTYETALQLKNAGFPQDSKGSTFMNYDIEVYEPTLSELITACGDRFRSLDNYSEEGWFAFAVGEHTKVGGSTPEEAVAKLYLELNKK